MIHILLNGSSGNMGKTFCEYIEKSNDKCEHSSNFDILYAIDKSNFDLFNNIEIKPDVIIDFSTPQATFLALDYAVQNLIPIVIATTGFSQSEENKIKEFSEAIPIFKSSNMSQGIHIFSNLASKLAKKFNNINQNVDIEIIEKHHRNKIDAPSGTALMIADNINKICNNKYKYVFYRSYKNSNVDNFEAQNIRNDFCNDNNKTRKNQKSYNEIGFSSIRGGKLIGEHTIIFLGENETIELTHTAYSRSIYIEGALHAAEFIISKKNGLYDMQDL